MKNLRFFTWIALLCLIGFFSCKKEAQQRTIVATTTNISSSTDYTIVVKNTTNNTVPVSIATGQGIGNNSYTFYANSGDVLNVQYAFYTTGQQYGQVNLDITSNGQNVLHANGGFGTNFIIKVP